MYIYVQEKFMVGLGKPAMYMYMNRVGCQTGYVYCGSRELTSSIKTTVQGSLGLSGPTMTYFLAGVYIHLNAQLVAHVQLAKRVHSISTLYAQMRTQGKINQACGTYSSCEELKTICSD